MGVCWDVLVRSASLRCAVNLRPECAALGFYTTRAFDDGRHVTLAKVDVYRGCCRATSEWLRVWTMVGCDPVYLAVEMVGPGGWGWVLLPAVVLLRLTRSVGCCARLCRARVVGVHESSSTSRGSKQGE